MRRTRFVRPNTRQSTLVSSSVIMASPAVAEGVQPRRYDYVESGTWALNPDGTASIDIGDDHHTVLTPFEFALLGQDLYRLISHENYVSSLSGLLMIYPFFWWTLGAQWTADTSDVCLEPPVPNWFTGGL